MKRLLLIGAVLLAACGQSHPSAPSSADTAASHLEPLIANGSGAQCTKDGVWCATANTDATTFAFSYKNKQVASYQLTDGGREIWTQIIRTRRSDGGEDALVGISRNDQQAYSGGGGQALLVSLYAVSSATPAPTHPALTFPAAASIDIRACFSEADQRARRDACSDQYTFNGMLSLDASTTPPKLSLTTDATTFPAGISRNSDNTHALQASDLRTVHDPVCSYHRVFTWDAASQTYKPDAPLPPCTDYLEP
ncbi:MAG: hypothetical protein QM759_17200 [Terricaulis sp.]